MTFCPDRWAVVANAQYFLALPNVACVGGSWLVPQGRLAAGNWDKITALGKRRAP